ncbi:MAG: hypothetical protein RR197_05270 [Oscillospiraceae bacterium]
MVQTGSISGNLLSVTFPQACYAYEGKLVGVMRAGIGDKLVTVSEIVMSVGEPLPNTLIDPGDVVPSLEQLLAQIGACEAATTSANSATGNANAAAASANTAAQAADAARELFRYIHVRYAASATPTDAQISATPNDFMGVALSASATAPINTSCYTWARINSAAIQTAVEQNAAEAASSAAVALSTANQIVTDEAVRQAAERGRVSAEQGRASAESGRVSVEQGRATAEQKRASAESGRASAECTRAANETARNTKLDNLNFGVTMIAPSGVPGAMTTQDADSIDVQLLIPASNLDYATFDIDKDGFGYIIFTKLPTI